jgi:cyclopropane fatty-acyl-phospholipid synthase-like methyltransferase
MVYSECNGPGGLQLTEFMAEKMQLQPGARLLDIGIDGIPHIEHLQRNARAWGVGTSSLG